MMNIEVNYDKDKMYSILIQTAIMALDLPKAISHHPIVGNDEQEIGICI
jgi:hypothetical protein